MTLNSLTPTHILRGNSCGREVDWLDDLHLFFVQAKSPLREMCDLVHPDLITRFFAFVSLSTEPQLEDALDTSLQWGLKGD